jgi:hypothetical protein
VKTKTISMGLLALVFTAAPLFALQASAEDATTADTDAGADAGTDASDDADADAGVVLPAFDEAPFPEEKSARPKDAEWKAMPAVAVSPGSYIPYSCKVYRIREWMQIRCTESTGQITMLGGNNPEDVTARLDPIMEEWNPFPNGAEIVFPVRRGDRRVFEWLGVEFGYRGANTATSFLVISEAWMPWEEKPTVFMR